jgi:hypothetical protein
MIHQISSALNAGVGQLTYFLTIKLIPFFSIELQIEILNKLIMNKVDKSISNITAVGKVNGQVQKIKLVLIILVYLFFQHLLGVFIGNMTNHERSPTVILNLL